MSLASRLPFDTLSGVNLESAVVLFFFPPFLSLSHDMAHHSHSLYTSARVYSACSMSMSSGEFCSATGVWLVGSLLAPCLANLKSAVSLFSFSLLFSTHSLVHHSHTLYISARMCIACSMSTSLYCTHKHSHHAVFIPALAALCVFPSVVAAA